MYTINNKMTIVSQEMPEAEQIFTGDRPLTSVNFTPDDVLKKLKKLNPNSAPGPDGIWI